MFDYWADLDVVTGSLENMNDADPRYWKLAKAMQRSINLWDEETTHARLGSKALDKGDAQPRQCLGHDPDRNGSLAYRLRMAVAGARNRTQGRAHRINALALMDIDPDFTYVMSAAQHFAWLEERHPTCSNASRPASRKAGSSRSAA